MRDFINIKCCAKGFFSGISILDNKWLLKIAKNEKIRFSLQWTGTRKTFRIKTPIIFHLLFLEGVILLQFFPIPARF